MKPLNEQAILAAYLRFLGRFILLMGGIVLLIFAFFKTSTAQINQLTGDKEQYENVLFTQRIMGQKVDSLYHNLNVLNTGLVHNDRLVEQRILREKDELNALLAQKIFARRPHQVYRKIVGYVNDMLVVKDSIGSAMQEIKAIRRELQECQQHEKLKS